MGPPGLEFLAATRKGNTHLAREAFYININRFNLNARGWHVARLRERRASSLSPFCFAGGASAVLSG